ncbi:hypothetical protein [Actibacterium sp. 188UL27-1]|uniref:hypothetical protein n=1 Tax=Actibacterium sp. 188UL27-1 TaxID=2786961 RepID=UPI001959B5B0|nr:hypothetical protein [Actibacterium sp. 188UL27-1]MBM7066802.1 hypothetical protein [Actibacterium sp. 188UL27-1]
MTRLADWRQAGIIPPAPQTITRAAIAGVIALTATLSPASANGSFQFQMDDVSQATLDIASTEMVLYRTLDSWPEEMISLSIEVTAAPKEAGDEDFAYTLEPRFYTEWLDISLDKLVSRDAGALDGYRLSYPEEKMPGAPTQMPAAIYQFFHGGIETLSLALDHLGGGVYDLSATGTAEFDMVFDIQTQVRLSEFIVTRDDNENANDPEVEAEMNRLLDTSQVQTEWRNTGGDSRARYRYVATFPENPTQ